LPPKAREALCQDKKNGRIVNPSDGENELLVRAMEPRDAEAVSLLSAELGYPRSAEAILQWIEWLAANPAHEQTAFVATIGDEVVGWIDISIEHRLQSPRFGYIGGLVVKEGVRGKGVGRRLCERAEAWAWDHSVEAVRVTSRSTRPDAHRFYLRDGYRELKTSMVFEKSRSR